MATIEVKHPDVYAGFLKGNFTMRMDACAFTAMAKEHAHEHKNPTLKGDGSSAGLTENPSSLQRWVVSVPEIGRVIAGLEAPVDKKKKTNLRHHEQTQQTQALCEMSKKRREIRVLEEMGNPCIRRDGKSVY